MNENKQSVIRLFSHLSISQRTKKKKSTMTNNQSSGIKYNVVNYHNSNHHQQQEDNDLSSTNHIKEFKPRYLRMSDKVFK